MIPWSPSGIHCARSARAVATITGSEAAAPTPRTSARSRGMANRDRRVASSGERSLEDIVTHEDSPARVALQARSVGIRLARRARAGELLGGVFAGLDRAVEEVRDDGELLVRVAGQQLVHRARHAAVEGHELAVALRHDPHEHRAPVSGVALARNPT